MVVVVEGMARYTQNSGFSMRVLQSRFPAVAHGTKIPGKFGRINGQITFNGLPLYGFAGEKSHQNFANGQFPVVRVP